MALEPVKETAGMAGVVDDGLADFGARAHDDVEDTGRKSRFFVDLGENGRRWPVSMSRA